MGAASGQLSNLVTVAAVSLTRVMSGSGGDVVIADHSLVHLAKRTLLADQDAVLRDDPGHIAFKGGNADQEQSERHDPECRNEWSAARGPGKQARDNNQ
jgi:hypothetical protein